MNTNARLAPILQTIEPAQVSFELRLRPYAGQTVEAIFCPGGLLTYPSVEIKESLRRNSLT